MLLKEDTCKYCGNAVNIVKKIGHYKSNGQWSGKPKLVRACCENAEVEKVKMTVAFDGKVISYKEGYGMI